MRIRVQDRLKPFSHKPGHETLIPGTYCSVACFPAFLECTDLTDMRKKSVVLPVKGPVSGFTVESDLEKRLVLIYGMSEEGYFRFVLKAEEDEVLFLVEKDPSASIEKKIVLIKGIQTTEKASTETLFLGSTKAKDLDKIRERRDLFEILPLWYQIGQITPEVKEEKGKMLSFLETCQTKIEKKDKEAKSSVLSLYLAGLSAGFVPRSTDTEFQGIIETSKSEPLSVIGILPSGASMIRSVFFLEKEGKYFFHPYLPPSFIVGKMIGVKTTDGDRFDFEWTKGRMRKVSVICPKQKTVTCVFPSALKRYRVRKNLKDKGKILKNGESFTVNQGETLFLDRFEM